MKDFLNQFRRNVYMSLSLGPHGWPGTRRSLASLCCNVSRNGYAESLGISNRAGVGQGMPPSEDPDCIWGLLQNPLSACSLGEAELTQLQGTVSCLSRAQVHLGGMEHPHTQLGYKAQTRAWHPPILPEVGWRDVPAFGPGLSFQTWSGWPNTLI